MDGKQNRLTRSNFDINAVIKNTAASFEGTCTAKHITIDLLFSDWHSYVNADMGKIQQVLYNLIDNAIKASKSGQEIEVFAEETNGILTIAVKDHGIGIPKEEMGRFALYLLLDRMKGGHSGVVRMELSGKLLVRNSCSHVSESFWSDYCI